MQRGASCGAPTFIGGAEEGGITKTLLYTLPRGVRVGRLRVVMEWVEWMWRVALSLACTEARPSDTPGTGRL